jgi:hypothetical protein
LFTEFLPLSQRNLPASFWISNYQYPISAGAASSTFSSFAHDLYHHHAHQAAAAAAVADPYSGNPLLGSSDVDPWQNYMAAAAGSAYSAAHHRAGNFSNYQRRTISTSVSSYLSMFKSFDNLINRQDQKSNKRAGMFQKSYITYTPEESTVISRGLAARQKIHDPRSWDRVPIFRLNKYSYIRMKC